MLINVAREHSDADASSSDGADTRIEPKFETSASTDSAASDAQASHAQAGAAERGFAADRRSYADRSTEAGSFANTSVANNSFNNTRGFKSSPATADVSGSRFFISPWRQTVLDTVRHLIALQQPLIWITGNEGVGKSVLLQHFQAFLRGQAGETLVLSGQEVGGSMPIYNLIAQRLQGSAAGAMNLDMLRNKLQELAKQRGPLRLLMDDVDLLTDAQIADLLRLQSGLTSETLQSLFFAHPSVMDICQAPAFQAIDQSMAEWVDVPPFNLKETHQFIEFYCLQHQLPSPGWRVEKIKRLHAKTEGLPGKLVPLLQGHGQALSIFSQWSKRFGVLPWIGAVLLGCGILLWTVFIKREISDTDSFPLASQAALNNSDLANSAEPIELSALNEPLPPNPTLDKSPAIPADVPAASQTVASQAAAHQLTTNQSLVNETQASKAVAENKTVTENSAAEIAPIAEEEGAIPLAEEAAFANAATKAAATAPQEVQRTKTIERSPAAAKTFAQTNPQPLPAAQTSQWEKVAAPKVQAAKTQSINTQSINTQPNTMQPSKSLPAAKPVAAKAAGVKPLETTGVKPVQAKSAEQLVVKEQLIAKDQTAVKDQLLANNLPPKSVNSSASSQAVISEATTKAAAPVARADWEYASWVAQRSPTHYTLQVLGSANKQRVLDFIRQHAPSSNGKLAYFPTQHQGQAWYVVIYGDFPSNAAAQAALPEVQPRMVLTDPWVRSFASVKAGVVQASVQ